MGQVLHGSATTTEAIRRAIQHSQASLRALSKPLWDQPKDGRQVAAADLGPRPAHGAEGSALDGAVTRGRGGGGRLSASYAPAPRRLPLRAPGHDPTPDPLVASSLPPAPRHQPVAGNRRRQAQTLALQRPIRSATFTSIWLRSTRRKGGSTCSSPSTARPSSAFVELHGRATRRVAGDFLRHLIEAVPYKVHTVLTDNGTHFTTPGNIASAASIIRQAIAAGETFQAHSFELACARSGYRASPDQAAVPLDQWAGRANEPHDQGRDHQALPLQQPHAAPRSPG